MYWEPGATGRRAVGNGERTSGAPGRAFTKRVYADVLLEQKMAGTDLMAGVIRGVKSMT